MTNAREATIDYVLSGVNGAPPATPPSPVRVIPPAVDATYAHVRHAAAVHRTKYCAGCGGSLPAAGWLVCRGPQPGSGFSSVLSPLCPACSASEPGLAVLRGLARQLDSFCGRDARLRRFGIVAVRVAARICPLCLDAYHRRQSAVDPFQQQALPHRGDHEIGLVWGRDEGARLCPDHGPRVLEAVMDGHYGRRRVGPAPTGPAAEAPHDRRARIRLGLELALAGEHEADGLDPESRRRFVRQLAAYVSGNDDGRELERARRVMAALRRTFASAPPAPAALAVARAAGAGT